jgi:hypothetical protein
VPFRLTKRFLGERS